MSKSSADKLTQCDQEIKMKYKKINDTTSIKVAENINNFFGWKYFCRTPTQLSTQKETRLPIAKKIQTKSGDLSCNKKKKMSVKWKHIHTKEDIAQYQKKLVLLVWSNELSTDTKFDIS